VTVSRGWLRIGVAVALAATWQLVAWRVHGLLFPSFTATVQALATLLFTARLWSALWLSHQALVLGFGSAIVVGVAVGFMMGRSRTIDAIADPGLTILLVTPMSALIPVVIMAVGLDLRARALVVFFFAVAVIAVNTRTGVRAIDRRWLEMVRSFGASERQLWHTVLLPGALPAIVTGLRLGLGRAFTGMVAVELLLVAVGVGQLIMDFQGAFDAGAVYAVVAVLIAETVVVLRVLTRLERHLAPWTGQVAVE